MKNFAIKLSGPAGAGMMQAGETLSKALNRLGFYTLMYPEYPSRIRGGDNHVLVVFSSEKYIAPVEKINLLLAFGRENLKRHIGELEGLKPSFAKASEGKGFEGEEIGLNEIAKELGNPLVANTAGLGFIFKTLGFDIGILEEQLKEEFKGKEEILKLNLEAAGKGYELGKNGGFGGFGEFGEKRKVANYSGNEALVEGILEGGCGFAAIYPMTPINSILTTLAKSKVTLFRPEDEIAGIMAALGASYAGKRAMIATSGGGFSLMVEGLGMAGMAEIPIVCIVGQRTGPSTGMATFSSQADLNFVTSAGQGEFPRIVLAPGDIQECYRLGGEAFNLAEKYRVPVILLTDKYLSESRFSTDNMSIFEYQQFLRTLPGQAVVRANSYEHDEEGFSCDDKANRERMMRRRMEKLVGLNGGFEEFGEFEGKKPILVGWGSTKEIILDFLKDHNEFNFVHIWRPWPFPKEAVEILKKASRIVVIEGNYSGQLADLIERLTFRKVERILKDDGRPFFGEDLRRLLADSH